MPRSERYTTIAIFRDVKGRADLFRTAYGITWNEFIDGCIKESVRHKDLSELEPLMDELDISIQNSWDDLSEEEERDVKRKILNRIIQNEGDFSV